MEVSCLRLLWPAQRSCCEQLAPRVRWRGCVPTTTTLVAALLPHTPLPPLHTHNPTDSGGIEGLDISPNGRRLATCGTEPQIAIWNLLPVLDPAAEADPSVPKALALLQEHPSHVLSVRFSHSGTLLASGSGDGSILIFKQLAAPARPQHGVGFTNIENWRPVPGGLKGHTMDVTGLSWSPGDTYLASGSMDGNVLVWRMDKGGCCVCRCMFVCLCQQ